MIFLRVVQCRRCRDGDAVFLRVCSQILHRAGHVIESKEKNRAVKAAASSTKSKRRGWVVSWAEPQADLMGLSYTLVSTWSYMSCAAECH